LAIITEGLLGYVSAADLEALWRRFATVLGGFAAGRYLSDLHLGSAQTPEVRVFRLLLAAFVRGGVYLHFADAAEAERRLREAGFTSATVTPADRLITDPDERPQGKGGQMAHILEASTE
jgi:O-methyltransferase involved in polyketide biosynthesis